MRVLHFFKTYYPDTFGGVERTIHAIAKGGLAHGIDSEVLSLSRDPAKNSVMFDGHMAHKARLDFELASTGFSSEAFARFRALSANADIVHYHFPWPFMDVLHLLYTPSKPSLVTYHSDIVKQKLFLKFYNPLMHRFLSSVTRIVATSSNYLESSKVLKRYNNKTCIIPLGLDSKDYPSAPKQLRNKWKLRFPRPFFLFIGVLRYYKGLHILIEAAKEINADIVIAGTGPMEGDLKAQVRRTKAVNVHFLGRVSDLDKSALLDACTAFVFPSHLRSEAYGLSLVEASMAGKAMISCEMGTGTSFVNIDNVTGIVCPPADVGSLRMAMHRLLEDEALRDRYGHAAKARYYRELTSRRMVEEYVRLYQSI